MHPFDAQDSVATYTQLLATGTTRHAIQWAVESGRWQRPLKGVLVAHSGEIVRSQQEWASVLWAGLGACLGAGTAAALDGLRGYEKERVTVVIPESRRLVVPSRAPWRIELRRSVLLGEDHVHPLRLPRRTRIARSLLDMAACAETADDAFAIVAAGVQQRLVTAPALEACLTRLPNLHRRRELAAAIRDIAGGSHSLPGREAYRLIRAAGLPRPNRQCIRTEGGRRRYLDLYWDEYGLVMEIDGRFHILMTSWIDDQDRDNDVVASGDSVLRFSAWHVRNRPERVVTTLRQSLLVRGWLPASRTVGGSGR